MKHELVPEVSVNGVTIPSAAIAAEAQNHQAPRGKPGLAWRKAANALAVRTLLLQEARRRNIDASPQELEPGRFETEDEAQIRDLLDVAVEIAPPSNDAIRQEWARDPARFRAPPLWEASHILIACDHADDTASAMARDRAVELTQRAQAAPSAFAKLAGSNSDCPSKAQGGMLGQIVPGDLVPEFEAALHALDQGDITAEPLKTRHGWHIVRMDEKGEGSVLPYEAVAPRIRMAMEKRAWSQAVKDFVAGLVAQAEIVGVDLAKPAS
jgi:peptidyl-prolyl cis-trans isomerase C